MLERPETGNKIELSIGKGQFFRRPAMKLRMGQRIPAKSQGHSREIDSRRDSAKRRNRTQPHTSATRDVQNSFLAPRLEAARQPSEMPRHLPRRRTGAVINAIVEVPNRAVVEVIHSLISSLVSVRLNRHGNVYIPLTEGEALLKQSLQSSFLSTQDFGVACCRSILKEAICSETSPSMNIMTAEVHMKTDIFVSRP